MQGKQGKASLREQAFTYILSAKEKNPLPFNKTETSIPALLFQNPASLPQTRHPKEYLIINYLQRKESVNNKRNVQFAL